ncbi:hypothetical protein P3X46_000146 [Hevea brasiliensis]|uniref:TF-B3 domain-containing protein n=1 Tax=Hevea brasiliensis TaxID=3981 RepID=A0ABQ9N8D1_HEVBR|nr:uncharacterized protein LOC110673329 [Hevea brasiliensis]XP_057993286.1 uncharacterized protein LOC110673329 [Hevea brasiliensis]KAJ9188782.1 hypothetical protein P3X46_000146 [Hevea brasiliensis]
MKNSHRDEEQDPKEEPLNHQEKEIHQELEKEPMFEKTLTPSDVGKLNRLVIPKQYAEKCFPLLDDSVDKMLTFEDELGKSWRFRYCYWNKSQSYVLTKGWMRFVKKKQLKAGDIILFEQHPTDSERLFIGWRKNGDNSSSEVVVLGSGLYHSFGHQPNEHGHGANVTTSVTYQPEYLHEGVKNVTVDINSEQLTVIGEVNPLQIEIRGEVPWKISHINRGQRCISDLRAKKETIEWALLITSLLLEGLSATFDQLGYALMGMVMAFVALLLSTMELIGKARNERVRWEWRSPLPNFYTQNSTDNSPNGELFGSLVEYFGLSGAVWQCLYSSMQYIYARRNLDNPIKMCLLPFIFVFCVLISKLVRG